MTEPSGEPSAASRLVAVLFEDRYGLAIFLTSVAFLGLLWRVGFFLTDSLTVANLLANVAGGRLEMLEAPYSLTAAAQPGLVEVGGRLYGRNYGQVYLAVPVLWILDAASVVADLRLLLAGLWSVAIVALGRTLGPILDRPGFGEIGALLGLGTMGIALVAWTPLAPVNRPLVALQLTTILAAAAAATLLYRLLAVVDRRRVAIAGGIAVIVATPVGFWGSLPKRHVFTAALLLLSCYWFAVSRDGSGRRATLARGGAYGAIGYLAAIHPFEAAFMLAVLAPIDLATARRAPLRQHLVVALVLLVATGPMLATNVAISGNPVESPRLLPSAGSGGLPQDLGDDLDQPDADGGAAPDQSGGGADSDGSGGTDGGGGGDGTDGGDPTPDSGLPVDEWLWPLFEVWATAAWITANLREYFVAGLAATLEPERLYHTFVRSGWITDGVRYEVNDFEAVELAFLEVLPLAGALASGPILAGDRLRGWVADRGSERPRLLEGIGAVDALAVGMAMVFLVIYLPLLPLHSMLTLRYVLPAMPLVVYGLCRLAPVRAAAVEAPRVLAGSYGATLLVGAVVSVLVLPVVDPAVGEAFQLHALIGLGSAGVAASAAATWPVHRTPRVVAVGLAIPAAATTLFIVFAALWHSPFAPFALDLSRLVAECLPPLG